MKNVSVKTADLVTREPRKVTLQYSAIKNEVYLLGSLPHNTVITVDQELVDNLQEIVNTQNLFEKNVIEQKRKEAAKEQAEVRLLKNLDRRWRRFDTIFEEHAGYRLRMQEFQDLLDSMVKRGRLEVKNGALWDNLYRLAYSERG